MAEALVPPTQGAGIGDLKVRVDAVERKLNAVTQAGPPQEVLWSASGDLSDVAALDSPLNESPVWSAPFAARVVGIRLQLHTAGGSDTVVTAVKNGSVVLTMTIPAGNVQWPVPAAIPMSPDSDRLHLVLVSGSGYHLSTSIRYRPQ